MNLGQFSQYLVEAWTEISKKNINFKLREKKWQRRLYNIQNNLPREAKNRIAVLLDIKPWKIETQQNNVALMKKQEIIKKYRYYLSR